jgi:hypothetical protein
MPRSEDSFSSLVLGTAVPVPRHAVQVHQDKKCVRIRSSDARIRSSDARIRSSDAGLRVLIPGLEF